MSAHHEARVPPRFVPTLTEVVQVPDWVLPAEPLNAPAPWAAFESESESESRAEAPADLAVDVPPPLALDAQADEITRRVTAHLEQRLAALLEEQSADMTRVLAQTVAQQLRGELPALVRQALQSSATPAAQWPLDGQ
jgi:hypothetical protein